MKACGITGGMSDFAAGFYRDVLSNRIELKRGRVQIITHERSERLIGQLAREGRWDDVVMEMVNAVQAMQRAGADFIVIPSFSLHRVVDAVASKSGVPILRMDDCIVEEAAKMDYQRMALFSASVVGDEFMTSFHERLVNSRGQKIHVVDVLPVSEFGSATLANESDDGGAWKKYLWIFLEEVYDAYGYTDVILNCSVEMMRMVGSRSARMPINNRDQKVPILDVVNLHIKAIMQEFLSEC